MSTEHYKPPRWCTMTAAVFGIYSYILLSLAACQFGSRDVCLWVDADLDLRNLFMDPVSTVGINNIIVIIQFKSQ